jgi:Amt family ammonium transporter
VSINPIDSLWLIISASFVFLMQIGFLCLEAGSTRRKNSTNVVIKNTVDFGVSVIAFWVVGYGLMFGHSQSGWIGSDLFLIDLASQPGASATFWIFQTMFCSTAVTILSGAVAERMSFKGYIVLAGLISGLIYPIYGHWAWNGSDALALSGWLGQRGFVDFAGATVVHSLGGWCALAAILFVGPRLGRFSKKRTASSFTGSDLPLAFMGTLLLWFGWFGFNGGSTLAFNEQVVPIIGNTLLAGSAGLVTPMLIAFWRQTMVVPKLVMNGALAGLVAITANCHTVSSASALVIGTIGSLVMLGSDWLLEQWHLDDAVGAVPVHLGAGIWGTLAVSLFGDRAVLGTDLDRLAQFKMQLLGVLACGLWTFGVMLLCLALLNRVVPLRVSHKQEVMGLNVAEHGAKGNLQDFYTQLSRHARTGDLRRSISADAFTEEGQLGRWYNRVVTTLEAAVEKTEAIFKTAGQGIITVSPTSFTIQSINPQVEQIFGYARSSLIAQSLSQVLTLPDEALEQYGNLTTLMEAVLASGQVYELVGKHQQGQTFPVEVTVTHTDVYRDSFYTLMVRDISERKRAEIALKQSELREREKATQLTETLQQLQQTQAKLIQTEKMAGLGQLAAGIAHEINNPVNFIHGNLEHSATYVQDLLTIVHQCCQQRTALPLEIQALLEELEAEFLVQDFPKLMHSMRLGTKRIQTIVQSLRTFVRHDEADLKSVDIHTGLESTLSILAQRLVENDQRSAIQVSRDYSLDCPSIECYAGQLNQVFLNVLTNAIEALDSTIDQPKVMIETQTQNHSVLIRIKDNGVGIADAIQSRIFEPFFTTKPVGAGSGLGLSISYQIVVEQHGGELLCESQLGQGTTITVKLPLIQPRRPAFSPTLVLTA